MDNLYFVVEYSKSERRKNVFQILYILRIKLVLFSFGIKASFAELFEYLFDIPVVYRHIIQVNKYIIKIDCAINILKIRKYVVHKSLEDYRGISKAK